MKAALKWLLTTVLAKPFLKATIPIILLVLFTMGLGALGMLPRSPVYYANQLLIGMAVDIPYTAYISAFVPVVPILVTFRAWVHAVIGFHAVKFYLRKAGFIY